MNRSRSILQTTLLWAMLPFTAFSGGPRSLCLCSHGDVRFFCHRQATAQPRLVATGPAASPKPCCRSSRGPRHHPAAGWVSADCHCTWFIALPDVLTNGADECSPDLASEQNAREARTDRRLVFRTPVDWHEDLPPPLAGRQALVAFQRWLT